MSAYPNSKVHCLIFFITSDFKGYVLWEFCNSRRLWECSSLSIVGCDISHLCSDGWVSFLWQFLDGSSQFMVVKPVAIRRQSCSQGQRMYALSLSLSLCAWDWSPGRCVLCCCRNRKPWDVETLILTIVFEVIWTKKVQVWTMCWTGLLHLKKFLHKGMLIGIWRRKRWWVFPVSGTCMLVGKRVSEQKMEWCSFQTMSCFWLQSKT